MAYNVLIVDDSPIVRTVVDKTLRLAGVELGEVSQAGNGREALELLNDHWVDIVFADINMPEMDGVEMVERMSQTGLLKTIPVVIVSTERSVTRIEELRAKGVRAYLNKPFTPEEIKKIVDELLGGQ
ncbi:MAG TPA: response regulator [Verrucomicrobiae bacterium]|nr:response regulator [Verrucomicrobiae bacterium]